MRGETRGVMVCFHLQHAKGSSLWQIKVFSKEKKQKADADPDSQSISWSATVQQQFGL